MTGPCGGVRATPRSLLRYKSARTLADISPSDPFTPGETGLIAVLWDP